MKILIAEDDARLLKSLIRIFELNNYSVDGVNNSTDAFDYALSGEYDGLVLDIMMPGIDGVNSLSVGSTINVTNPVLDTEAYTLTVVGIYTSSENNDFSMSMFGASQDPANKIYMSANELQVIIEASEATSTTITDDYGRTKESKIDSTLSAVYSF